MAKAKKNPPARSNTGEIVLSAIKKLTKNTGWTVRTIVKFIRIDYGLNDENLSRKISRALKRGVKLGVLQLERGRYRLNDMSRLAGSTCNCVPQKEKRQVERPLRIRSRSRSRSQSPRSRSQSSRSRSKHYKYTRR